MKQMLNYNYETHVLSHFNLAGARFKRRPPSWIFIRECQFASLPDFVKNGQTVFVDIMISCFVRISAAVILNFYNF